jgi:hypothetical protein
MGVFTNAESAERIMYGVTRYLNGDWQEHEDSHYLDTKTPRERGDRVECLEIIGVPNGIRTRVSALKGPRPGPD